MTRLLWLLDDAVTCHKRSTFSLRLRCLSSHPSSTRHTCWHCIASSHKVPLSSRYPTCQCSAANHCCGDTLSNSEDETPGCRLLVYAPTRVSHYSLITYTSCTSFFISHLPRKALAGTSQQREARPRAQFTSWRGAIESQSHFREGKGKSQHFQAVRCCTITRGLELEEPFPLRGWSCAR